mgnify:CR=1 FL=1
MLGGMWRNLSQEQKEKYIERQKRNSRRHSKTVRHPYHQLSPKLHYQQSIREIQSYLVECISVTASVVRNCLGIMTQWRKLDEVYVCSPLCASFCSNSCTSTLHSKSFPNKEHWNVLFLSRDIPFIPVHRLLLLTRVQ